MTLTPLGVKYISRLQGHMELLTEFCVSPVAAYKHRTPNGVLASQPSPPINIELLTEFSAANSAHPNSGPAIAKTNGVVPALLVFPKDMRIRSRCLTNPRLARISRPLSKSVLRST